MVVVEMEPIDTVTAYGSTIRRKLSCNSIDSFYGMISIRANEIEELTDRKSVVLVSVVDKSGSMTGTKIMALKQTLLCVVQALGPNDSFGIVEYDSNVNITFPLTKMTEEAKEKATNIVLKLQPGSSTNLSSGLLEGIRMIPKEINETVISSVFLMTDGLANNGITTTSGILSMIDFEEKTTQYTINTFGYGVDHDTDMLKRIADAGNGMYYFIENDSSVAANFADCLGGLFSMIGQGLEFTITAQGGHKITKIWSQHVNEIEPVCKYRVNLGDIQAGESRDIPIQFSLAESTPNPSQIIAEAAISYYNVLDEKMIGLNCTLTVSRLPQSEEINDPVNIDIDKHRNRCLGGQALLDASQLASSGKISEARNYLQKAIDEIEASDSASDSFCVTLLGEMRTALSGFVDRSTFRSRGQFTARGRGGSYVSQRSSPASSSGALFGTNARTAMLQMFNTPIPIPEVVTSVPSNSRGQRCGIRGSYPTRGRARGTKYQ